MTATCSQYFLNVVFGYLLQLYRNRQIGRFIGGIRTAGRAVEQIDEHRRYLDNPVHDRGRADVLKRPEKCAKRVTITITRHRANARHVDDRGNT